MTIIYVLSLFFVYICIIDFLLKKIMTILSKQKHKTMEKQDNGAVVLFVIGCILSLIKVLFG